MKYTKGDDWGLVGFDKALSEEDIAYVKEHIKTLSSKEVTWSVQKFPAKTYMDPKVPLGQRVHFSEPTLSAKVPIAQGMQFVGVLLLTATVVEGTVND